MASVTEILQVRVLAPKDDIKALTGLFQQLTESKSLFVCRADDSYFQLIESLVKTASLCVKAMRQNYEHELGKSVICDPTQEANEPLSESRDRDPEIKGTCTRCLSEMTYPSCEKCGCTVMC